MTKHEIKAEELTKALESAQWTRQELRNCLAVSGPVEAIVLLRLITDASELATRIAEFANAIQSKE